MVEAGFRNLVVCHLNHGLRGRASSEDARFVKRLAAHLGLECEIGRVEVKRLIAQRGESMETAARFARHTFFAECATQFKCNRIVLAHHADDQAETVLWNLLRGSNGLKGMRAEQRMTTETGRILVLHRPLLGVRRAELVGWLESHKKLWREDASNALPVAVRNRLRNEAIPLLAEISNRDPVAALVRAAEAFTELQQLEAWALERANVLDPQGRLHLPTLRDLPLVMRRAAIVRYLKEAGVGEIDHDLVARALDLCDSGNSPAVNLPGGGSLRRRGGRLFLQHESN